MIFRNSDTQDHKIEDVLNKREKKDRKGNLGKLTGVGGSTPLPESYFLQLSPEARHPRPSG